ncbi:MAG: glycosyltransferase family 39 protein, partial [Deltaproteobacteria bacterium]|nr:glycosyltransferase family 39 protein [Deltaproteobacteria bacterium]
FLLAMIVRGFIFGQILDHPEVVFKPDSRMYVSLAEGLTKYGSFVYPETPARPDVERMPGYPLFLASVLWLFGGSLLPVVVIQIILDSLSCVLIYRLGETIWKGAGLLSGVLASLNIGMITYSHFILNDSLFLFFFLVLLIMTFKFLGEPEWKYGVILGACMGVAALIRPVIVYIPLLFIPFFFIYFTVKLKFTLITAAGKVIFVGLIFILSISPWLIRNYVHYGRFKLTAQSGEHLLQYVVPFVWQYSKGVPFIEGMKKTSEEFQEKAEEEGIDIQNLSPFEKSDLQVEMALDILGKEPKSAIIKAWVFGIIKNIFSPAIIDLSYLLDIERPHFFYSEGATLLERARNFILNMPGFFGWAVIGSLVIMVLTRFLLLWGFIITMRHRLWEGLFLFLIILYFLLVSGPVGYAKYRLPFEPALIILMAIGIKSLARFYKTRPRRSLVREVDVI